MTHPRQAAQQRMFSRSTRSTSSASISQDPVSVPTASSTVAPRSSAILSKASESLSLLKKPFANLPRPAANISFPSLIVAATTLQVTGLSFMAAYGYHQAVSSLGSAGIVAGAGLLAVGGSRVIRRMDPLKSPTKAQQKALAEARSIVSNLSGGSLGGKNAGKTPENLGLSTSTANDMSDGIVAQEYASKHSVGDTVYKKYESDQQKLYKMERKRGR